jgi:hypothetical protein
MTYEKPEVVSLTSAFSAIRCTGAKSGGPKDSQSGCGGNQNARSAAAYEADE